jgi:hypothetical protein
VFTPFALHVKTSSGYCQIAQGQTTRSKATLDGFDLEHSWLLWRFGYVFEDFFVLFGISFLSFYEAVLGKARMVLQGTN